MSIEHHDEKRTAQEIPTVVESVTQQLPTSLPNATRRGLRTEKIETMLQGKTQELMKLGIMILQRLSGGDVSNE